MGRRGGRTSITLRLVFDREDLERVRLAAGADPMWELVLGLICARTAEVPSRYRRWRELVRRRGPSSPATSLGLSMLAELVPTSGSFPDLLTPTPVGAAFDAGCEAVAAVTRSRLASDIEAVFAHRAAPSWAQELARGDRHRIGELLQAIRQAHEYLIGPYWEQINETVTADRDRRRQQVGDHGVGELLRNLPGVIGWDGRVLTTAYPVRRTVMLGGRGLTVVPSYFCSGRPVTFIDPELPPVLVYPAEPIVDSESTLPGRPSDSLVALFGRTRAHSLHALRRPRTTSGIAEELGASVSAASKQTTVLRDAGLVASARKGPAVVHRLTDLGKAVLRDAGASSGEGFPQWAKA